MNEALAVNQEDVAALTASGVVYQTKGDIPRAQVAYERALAVEPRLATAANNLAYLYSEHGGDKEKALQLAQMAKEGEPENPNVSDTLGWILYKRGVYQRALSLFQESATKLPDDPEIQYHLGLAHSKLGNKEAGPRLLRLSSRFPAPRKPVAICESSRAESHSPAQSTPSRPPRLDYPALTLY
jgi:Flp pilus assembly protein TadD